MKKMLQRILGALPIMAALAAAPAVGQVTVTVNWGTTTGSTGRFFYGLNLWGATDSAVASNSTFKSQLDSLNPGIVRLHHADMVRTGKPQSWINSDGSWNSSKIQNILLAIDPVVDEICINVPGPAPHLDLNSDGKPDNADAYGTWVGQLVDIVKASGVYVKWWEPINEKDIEYGGNQAAHAAAVNKATGAIKARDGQYQVVAPAWENAYDTTNMQTFAAAANSLYAFSYHQYGTGEAGLPASNLYSRANSEYKGRADAVRTALDSAGRTGLKMWLTEYHMYSSWDKDTSAYMRNGEGAVFIAMVNRALIDGGKVHTSHVFNDTDGTYGLFDTGNSYALRPSGHYFKLATDLLVGTRYSATSADRTKIETQAFDNGPYRTVLLINRSGASQTVNLSFTGWTTSGSFTRHTVSDSGLSTTSGSFSGAPTNLSLPVDSVTWVRISG